MSLDLPKLPQSFPQEVQVWWQMVVDALITANNTLEGLIENLATTQAELTLAQAELESVVLQLQQVVSDLEQAVADIIVAQATADSASTAAATAQSTADSAATAAAAAQTAADAATTAAADAEAAVAALGTVASIRSNTTALGYATGAGGTVTQATSKSTSVTLNTLSGKITMNNAALANATTVSFVLNNGLLGTDDILVVMITGGATNGAYICGVGSTTAGVASIYLRNESGGSLSEAVEIGFVILKAATS